jgi:hypothetical protein
VLAAGTAAIGVAYLGLAVAPGLAVACAISAVGGAGNGVQWVSVVSAVQEATADAMQGRVIVLLEAISAGVPILGFAGGGVVATVASPRTAYAVAGAGVLAVLGFAALRLRGAPWPERGVIGPEEAATTVSRGPVP